MNAALEAVLVGAAGAILGGAVGSVFDPVVGVIFAIVAGVNGGFSGYRQIYHWRTWKGNAAFVLDSTWGLIGTAIGNLLHIANLFWPKWEPPQQPKQDRRVRYSTECSRRQNRHVYLGGAALQARYAFTHGNVISNADSARGKTRPLFLARHEELHIWQNRWFGPLYQAIYALWFVLGGAVGIAYGLARRPSPPAEQPADSEAETRRLIRWLRKCGRTVGYYDCPFEWWAYVNDNNWPPGEGSAVRPLVWPKPAEQSEELRRERDEDRGQPCVPPA